MQEPVKILIVDDEMNMLITLQDILDVHGYEIFTAVDGNEAIEISKSQKVDLILMDFKMPGLNGVQTYEEIRKIHPLIKVIFITAYYDEKTLKEASADGIYGVFHKPLDIPQLLEYIKTATDIY